MIILIEEYKVILVIYVAGEIYSSPLIVIVNSYQN